MSAIGISATPVPVLAIIGEPPVGRTVDADAFVVADPPGLVASERVPAVIVLTATDSERLEQTALAVRRDRRLSGIPLFVLGIAPESAPVLLDGVVGSIAEARTLALPYLESAQAFPDATFEADADVRLLRFLYVRPAYRLVPVRAWDAPAGYRYPILEALANEIGDVVPWLRSLESRGLLVATTLLDRQRHCPSCDHVQLNYVDVCPSDGSIDIVNVRFLHCFSCGNVAPEAAFLERGRLVCPKCRTQLRQIGVDYDRALESYHCNSDGVDFTEPEVVANCLNCGRRSAPETLVARDVRVYILSDAGRLAARTEQISDVFAPLDNLNFATRQFFNATLDWFVAMQQRYHDTPFALIGVRIENLADVVSEIGRVQATLLMDEVARRLRELVRTTDIAVRTGEAEMWVLLPRTDAGGAALVVGKVAAIEHAAQAGLHLRTVAVSSDDLEPDKHAETLMARLANGFDT